MLYRRRFILFLTYPLHFIVHPCDQEENGGCEHLCEKVGSKAVCKCNKNFKLDKDGKNCTPVHVCDRKNNAGCSQVCIKDGKKGRCSCNEGFKLLPDKMTCEKSKLPCPSHSLPYPHVLTNE